jgi:hypothetical protein
MYSQTYVLCVHGIYKDLWIPPHYLVNVCSVHNSLTGYWWRFSGIKFRAVLHVFFRWRIWGYRWGGQVIIWKAWSWTIVGECHSPRTIFTMQNAWHRPFRCFSVFLTKRVWERTFRVKPKWHMNLSLDGFTLGILNLNITWIIH